MKTAAALMCPLLLVGCASEAPRQNSTPVHATARGDADATASIEAFPVDPGFEDYWYQGKAEITSYHLEQPRYGEVRHGKSVLIFVTEGFSRKKHVKLDAPAGTGKDKVTVLKLNRTRSFVTGIYPYSMMSSVFTPVSGNTDARTLKVTTSSQEWCGHSFVQFDLQDRGYLFRQHSYFERLGDRTATLQHAILEDEIWTKIRINPGALPSGEILIIPGSFYQTLSHHGYSVELARAHLSPAGDHEMTYTVTYKDRMRTLAITFNTAFPYQINEWEASYQSQSAESASLITTRAWRDTSLVLDYWTRNRLADEALRDVLNLD